MYAQTSFANTKNRAKTKINHTIMSPPICPDLKTRGIPTTFEKT